MKENGDKRFKIAVTSVVIAILIAFAYALAYNGRYTRLEGAAMFDKWKKVLLVPSPDGTYVPYERE